MTGREEAVGGKQEAPGSFANDRMKKNLILGTAIGYNYYHIHRFLFTLKRTGYTGDVCLFAQKNIGKSTLSKLQEQGVLVELIDFTFPYLDRPHADNFKTLPSPIHLFNYRHYLYYDFLLRYGSRYKYVMLSDVRDVIFQKDPFGFDINDQLCLAMVSKDKTLASCLVNSQWLISGYGDTVLNEIGHQRISCPGTTWGKADVVREYVKAMVCEFFTVKDAYHCIDQAIHNRLLYSGAIGNVCMLNNEDGPVLTMRHMKTYNLNASGQVINEKGDVVNTVHQYYCYRALARRINRKCFSGMLHKERMKVWYKIDQWLSANSKA